jgi:hypothetical protein
MEGMPADSGEGTSVSVWHLQALRAAQISGVGGERLREAMQEAPEGGEPVAGPGSLPVWGRQTEEAVDGEMMHWYFTIQALYHQNPHGEPFRTYYPALVKVLVLHQKDDGHWECFTARGREQGPVCTTAIAVLSMTFSGYLPTINRRGLESDDVLPPDERDAEENGVHFQI